VSAAEGSLNIRSNRDLAVSRENVEHLNTGGLNYDNIGDEISDASSDIYNLSDDEDVAEKPNVRINFRSQRRGLDDISGNNSDSSDVISSVSSYDEYYNDDDGTVDSSMHSEVVRLATIPATRNFEAESVVHER
jgi:hypothetical protein